MGLSANRIVYGIHNMAPYRRTDGLPYGTLKVIGGGSLSLSAEFEDLFGGSNKYAWASEAKTASTEFTSTVKSLPDFLFELYLGASVSTTAASATGSVIDALANAKGASVADGSIGIDNVAIKTGSEADVKGALYVVEAVSATTVDVYALTDVDFANGASLEYIDDSLKINAAPITIVASTAADIPNAGLELTGGSGTIGMTVGDTATFRVAAAHGGVSKIIIGQAESSFPEHGIVALAAKRADGSLFEIEMFKCVGSGFPIALEETVFSIPELTIKVLYDDIKNKVAEVTATAGV